MANNYTDRYRFLGRKPQEQAPQEPIQPNFGWESQEQASQEPTQPNFGWEPQEQASQEPIQPNFRREPYAEQTVNYGADPVSREPEPYVRPNSGSYTGIDREKNVYDTMIRAIDGGEHIFRFGSLLFRGENAHRINVVGQAVEGMDQRTAQALVDGRYFPLTTNLSNLFLSYDHSKKVSRYVAFTFRLPAGYHSLRELMTHSEARKCGRLIFVKLVSLLSEYEAYCKRTAKNPDGAYVPLCCLNLDTVFLHETTLDLKVIPLAAQNHDYPCYYPGEAGDPAADIRTDLYTAALTALQFMSGIELESAGAEMLDCSGIPCMDDCLRVLQSRRPDLRTVMTQLKPNRSEDSNNLKFNYGPDGENLKKNKKFIPLDALWKKSRGRKSETYSGISPDDF